MSELRKIKAGDMRHAAKIERRHTGGDIDADPDRWIEFAETRCALEPMRVETETGAVAVFADITHRVVCRYVPGVTTEDRLNINGRKLYIESVRNIEERNRYLVLLASERMDF